MDAGCLIELKPNQSSDRLARGKFASILNHHRMLRDASRVLAYRDAIMRHCRGKRVLEIGCGSGLLSIFASLAGAASVVAIEESEVANLAEEMFNANSCDLAMHRGNSADVDIGDRADVLIHELIGVDPIGENILQHVRDAKTRLLNPHALFIPNRLEILVVGVDSNQVVRPNAATLSAEAAELGRLYGIQMEPMITRLNELSARDTMPRFIPTYGTSLEARILTQGRTLLDINFSEPQWTVARAQVLELPIQQHGTINGFLIYFRAQLDESVAITNSPYAPPTH